MRLEELSVVVVFLTDEVSFVEFLHLIAVQVVYILRNKLFIFWLKLEQFNRAFDKSRVFRGVWGVIFGLGHILRPCLINILMEFLEFIYFSGTIVLSDVPHLDMRIVGEREELQGLIANKFRVKRALLQFSPLIFFLNLHDFLLLVFVRDEMIRFDFKCNLLMLNW